MAKKKRIVIAIGGNSLIRSNDKQSMQDQYEAACETAVFIANIIEVGWQVVVTHGNGPQVGFAMVRSELGAKEAPLVPLVNCVADTQGGIGFQLTLAINNELLRKNLPARTVTLLTHVVVDKKDPAFTTPTKFIGSFYEEAQLSFLQTEHPDWILKADANRGWRRVVPSPEPKEIVELEAITHLLDSGCTVIACGGGGIPVIKQSSTPQNTKGQDSSLQGVDAVIDKDAATCLLAQYLHADTLIISTAVEYVALHFGTQKQENLQTIRVSDLEKHYEAGYFPAGSMGPKVRSAIDFIRKGGKRAIITTPEKAIEALAGTCGTIIVPD